MKEKCDGRIADHGVFFLLCLTGWLAVVLALFLVVYKLLPNIAVVPLRSLWNQLCFAEVSVLKRLFCLFILNQACCPGKKRLNASHVEKQTR